MIAHAIKQLYLRYPRYPEWWIPPSLVYRHIFIRAIFIESNYAIPLLLGMNAVATFEY